MARRVCGAETIVLFLDANSVDLSHTTVKHALPELEAPTRGLRSLGRRYEVSGFRSKVSSTHAHIRGATRS